jgi:DNA-binding protein Alba
MKGRRSFYNHITIGEKDKLAYGMAAIKSLERDNYAKVIGSGENVSKAVDVALMASRMLGDGVTIGKISTYSQSIEGSQEVKSTIEIELYRMNQR